MNRYTGDDKFGQAGDWLMGTARRNPEALLVLAAGAALLLRSGRASASDDRAGVFDTGSHGMARQPARWSDGLSHAADSAGEYASGIKDRVSETANSVSEAATSYASSVSDYASGVGRQVSEQTSRFTDQARSSMQAGFGQVLRDQPLALAVLGVAAGATLAALFPTTEAEDWALGPARDAMADAASKVGDNLMGAAGEAGERLKQGAAQRGLSSQGLKELAQEVADTFADNVSGKSDETRTATTAQAAPSGRSGP